MYVDQVCTRQTTFLSPSDRIQCAERNSKDWKSHTTCHSSFHRHCESEHCRSMLGVNSWLTVYCSKLSCLSLTRSSSRCWLPTSRISSRHSTNRRLTSWSCRHGYILRYVDLTAEENRCIRQTYFMITLLELSVSNITFLCELLNSVACQVSLCKCSPPWKSCCSEDVKLSHRNVMLLTESSRSVIMK